MKKFDFVLAALVVGTLAYQVPTTWAAEITNLLTAETRSHRGISAHETVMKSPGTQAFARSSAIVGQVVAVDTANEQLTIRDEFTGHEHVFSAKNPEALTGLQPGTRVRIHDRDFRQGSSYRGESKSV